MVGLVILLALSLIANGYFALAKGANTEMETMNSTRTVTTITTTSFPNIVIESHETTYSTTMVLTVTVNRSLTLPFISSVLTANASLDFSPGAMSANPSTGILYSGDGTGGNYLAEVGQLPNGNVSILGLISLPGNSQGNVVVDQTNDMVYVPVFEANGSRLLVEINGNTGDIVATVPTVVTEIAVDQNTGTVYGVESSYKSTQNSTLFVINGSSLQTISVVSLPEQPVDLAVDQNTSTVYVTACVETPLTCENNTVLAINPGTLQIQSILVPTAIALDGLGINPNTNLIYTLSYENYLNSTGPELVTINGTTNQVIGITRLTAFLNGAYTLVVDPVVDEVLVLSASSVIPGDGVLTILDGANNNILNELFIPSGPNNMATDGDNVFISTGATSNSTSLIILSVREIAFP